MADQTIPDYETIRAAVTGETWAVEKVLMCQGRNRQAGNCKETSTGRNIQTGN